MFALVNDGDVSDLEFVSEAAKVLMFVPLPYGKLVVDQVVAFYRDRGKMNAMILLELIKFGSKHFIQDVHEHLFAAFELSVGDGFLQGESQTCFANDIFHIIAKYTQ